jgi:hypothetical protein
MACKVISLSPSQQHYLVVYHNMTHFNGGLGIKNQFDGFVRQNFSFTPGCDGIPVNVPIACNGYY